MPLNGAEQEAVNLGWAPKDQWRGDPEHWMDAETFLERGRHLLPILQKNNERLQEQLHERDQRIAKAEQAIAEGKDAIAALEKHYTEANKRQLDEAKAELKAALKSARKEGDFDTAATIEDQLDELRETKVDEPIVKKVEPKEAANSESGALTPEFMAWQKENSWFGQDRQKTKAVMRIAEDMRDDGNKLMGRPFYDEMMRLYNAQSQNREGDSKVEGGGPQGSGPKGRRFNDLPAEAKVACHSDNRTLVGKGKRFETVKDWEDQYARIYFGESE